MAINKRWQYLIFFLLAAFVALVPFDWFLGQYRYLGTLIGLHTMVIVGLCLVMGYTGQVSLGQAAFFGTGMYTSAILTSEYDYNAWVAMVIGAAGTAALALVLAPIFRLRGNYLALATLAVGYIVWKLASIDEWDHTGGPDGIRGIPYLSIGGFEFDSDFRRYFLVWGICFVILVLSQNIVNSRIGRALRAIHGSEDAAEALGINILWFKVKIFVLGAVFGRKPVCSSSAPRQSWLLHARRFGGICGDGCRWRAGQYLGSHFRNGDHRFPQQRSPYSLRTLERCHRRADRSTDHDVVPRGSVRRHQDCLSEGWHLVCSQTVVVCCRRSHL